MQPLTSSTANPSAATAAVSAFKRREPTPAPSLSSAAAAAALKARPHTPTNVGQVQTKRTGRRSASVSSWGSAGSAPARPSLQRRGSSGSMTERSFRSPSPHRPHTSDGRGSVHTFDDAPTVPTIPKNVANGNHRKSNSLGIGPTPIRTASQKMKQDGKGTWFGKAAVGDSANVRKSDAAMDLSKHSSQVHSEARPSSRSSSVNFSYPSRVRSPTPSPSPTEDPIYENGQAAVHHPPRRPPTASPSGSARQRPKSVTTVQSLVYDPNSRRMVPRIETVVSERQVPELVEKRSHKKQLPPKAGAHLASGTVARSKGTEVHDRPTGAQENRWTQPAQQSSSMGRTDSPSSAQVQPKRAPPTEAARSPSPEARQRSPSPTNEPQVSVESHQCRQEARPLLNKRPSTVHEESEPEVDEPSYQGSNVVYDQVDSIPIKQNVAEPVLPVVDDIALTTIPPSSTGAAGGITAAEMEGLPQPTNPSQESYKSPTNENIIKAQRSQSNSPARTAHFGSVQNNLAVRHSPPTRSISPRKSALKHPSPSRAGSPSTDTSEFSGSVRDEAAPSRKKSVRVSFNEDNNIILGQTTSPERSDNSPYSSPPSSKRPWYTNIGRHKKKDSTSSLDDEEIMKPRPALPFFGSVREKKPQKEPEERPLVRPQDHVHAPAASDSPASAQAVSQDVKKPVTLAASSDAAVGSILAQDQLSKVPANTSRFREPLPPVVTSIEGHEYVSDTNSSESEPEEATFTPQLRQEESMATSQALTEPESDETPAHISNVAKPAATAQPIQTSNDAVLGQTEQSPSEPTVSVADSAQAKPVRSFEGSNVPEISITQPSQERLVASAKEPEPVVPRSAVVVPGMFPDDDDDSDASTHEPSSIEAPVTSREATFEPVAQATDAYDSPRTPATVLATHQVATIAEESDETGSSIYSDAYEDLSDIEGDGFQSLNAVVEGPLVTSAAMNPLRPTQSKSEQAISDPSAAVVRQLLPAMKSSSSLQPRGEDDWENAKSFWRSLTADKRAQLEREALEEAGAEADLEGAKQAKKKPRSKKSAEKRNAEKVALQAKITKDPERTYMIQPGTKLGAGEYSGPKRTAMRSSLRGEAPAQNSQQPEQPGRMRRSMRGTEAAAGMGQGVSQQSRAQRTNSARPMSLPAPEVAASKRHTRARSDGPVVPQTQAKSAFAPSLRRRGSDSSESSFRRARPQTSGGGFGFRRTMREPGPPSLADAPKENSSRFSLRSLSPQGSAFRRNSAASATSPPAAGSHMRSSLRDPAHSKFDQGGGLRFPGFGAKKQPKLKNKGSQRFSDSSDDDGDLPRRVNPRSARHLDESSDDEPVPIKLPPLIIPKTTRNSKVAELRSPPLPEEEEGFSEASDAEPPNATGSVTQGSLGAGTVRRTRSGRGEIAPASPSSPSTQRRGFMSALRRKKGDGINRGERVDSAARRDTKLERSSQELEAVRSNSLKKSGPPRLQKRAMSMPTGQQSRGTADGMEDWPLPTPDQDADRRFFAAGTGDASQRPATSGGLGVGGSSRPAFLERRSLSQGVLGIEEVNGTTVAKPKKKKFGALRRMFRLDD